MNDNKKEMGELKETKSIKRLKKFILDHHCTDNSDILNRAVAGTGFCFADFVNNIHTLYHFPKDRVFGIEEVVVDKVDEELAAAVFGPAFAMEIVPRSFRLVFVNSSFIL